jgi:hypothetical protein
MALAGRSFTLDQYGAFFAISVPENSAFDVFAHHRALPPSSGGISNVILHPVMCAGVYPLR